MMPARQMWQASAVLRIGTTRAAGHRFAVSRYRSHWWGTENISLSWRRRLSTCGDNRVSQEAAFDHSQCHHLALRCKCLGGDEINCDEPDHDNCKKAD